MNEQLISLVQSSKYYEELYELPWRLLEKKPMRNKRKLRIGLINVPCGGFGDIIVCQTFYEYLKCWYPNHEIVLCTTTPEKFKKLGIDTRSYKKIFVHGDSECELYNLLYFKKQPKKFDIMICIPIINYQFNINQFKKFIPYANLFNTFTMSEYNGYIPPYTFPIGVGKGQLGLFLTKQSVRKHNLVEGPYALVYIQPSPQWGVHSRSCFLKFVQMISKKYHKAHPFFQIVLQQWLIDDLTESPNFKSQFKKALNPYYTNIYIRSADANDLFIDGDGGNSLVLRGDILPKPRPEFISLMKHSVEDILLTGDQSITDCFSACDKKHIWYQIAPWKTDFADNLSKCIPDKFIDNFRTTCGSLKGIKQTMNYKPFLNEYDFRKLGKIRMDSIVNFTYNLSDFEEYMDIVLHSRSKESVIKKLKNKI